MELGKLPGRESRTYDNIQDHGNTEVKGKRAVSLKEENYNRVY